MEVNEYLSSVSWEVWLGQKWKKFFKEGKASMMNGES